MNKKIGYLTFGRDDLGYGLSLVLDRLQKHELYRITPKTCKYVDILMFSCFWWEHIYLLAEFLRKSGISKHQKDRPKIIIGGFNTFNPVPFKCYSDIVVCGDGEGIINDIIEGYDPGFVWINNHNLSGYSHVTNNVTRLEVARGCKYKCKFCAVSHLKPYREIDIKELELLIKKATTKKISAFSPEPTLHTENKQITEICHKYNKTRLDTDVRLDRISRRHNDGGLLRCGIEGVSEKLRKSVSKGYSNDLIFSAVEKVIKNNRPGMLFYIILDLPGETDEDFNEFKELMYKIETIPGCENFLLVPSPSVFLPNPHTPMEYEEIHWERNYADKWKYLFRPNGYKERPWKFQMAERARVFSPAMRILSMISTRAGEEFYEIEKELSYKKIIGITSAGRVKCNSLDNLLIVLKGYGGVEKYCGRYTEDIAPWKVLTFEATGYDNSAGDQREDV